MTDAKTDGSNATPVKKPRTKKVKTEEDEILVQIFLNPEDHAKLCEISKTEVRRPAHQARKFVEDALQLYFSLGDSNRTCLLLLSKKLAEMQTAESTHS